PGDVFHAQPDGPAAVDELVSPHDVGSRFQTGSVARRSLAGYTLQEHCDQVSARTLERLAHDDRPGRFELRQVFEVMVGEVTRVVLNRQRAPGGRCPDPPPVVLTETFQERDGPASHLAEGVEILAEVPQRGRRRETGSAGGRGWKRRRPLEEHPLKPGEDHVPLTQGRRVSRVGDRPCARLFTRSGVPPSVSSSSWWVIGRRSWRVSRMPSPRGRLRLVAQVGGLYLGVVQERRGRALEDDTSALEHVGAVGDFEGEVRVLLDEERR